MGWSAREPVPDFSERIYSGLLWLYPARYRHEYGVPMEQLFRDLRRDAASDPFGSVALWAAILSDTLVSASIEHFINLRSWIMKSPCTVENLSLRPGWPAWAIVSAAVIGGGLLAKSGVIAAGGPVILGVLVALLMNTMAALIMEYASRARGVILAAAAIIMCCGYLPLAWVADPTRWLRTHPSDSAMIFVVILSFWTGFAKGRWPIFACALILGAAEIVSSLI